MNNLFQLEKELFSKSVVHGSEVELAIIAVLYLFFFYQQNENQYIKNIAKLGLTFLIVLLIPGVLWVLSLTGEFANLEKIFGVMPPVFLFALAATCFLDQKKAAKERLILIMGMLLIVLAGISVPWTFNTEYFSIPVNKQKIPAETVEIARITKNEMTFLPERVYGQMTEYRGDNNYVTATDSSRRTFLLSTITDAASANSCVYIVVPKCINDKVTMQNIGYKRIAKTQNYDIYRIEKQ